MCAGPRVYNCIVNCKSVTRPRRNIQHMCAGPRVYNCIDNCKSMTRPRRTTQHMCAGPRVYNCIVNCKSVTRPRRNVTWPVSEPLAQENVLPPTDVAAAIILLTFSEGARIESLSEHRLSWCYLPQSLQGNVEKTSN
jgi:hypothetical protein